MKIIKGTEDGRIFMIGGGKPYEFKYRVNIYKSEAMKNLELLSFLKITIAPKRVDSCKIP